MKQYAHLHRHDHHSLYDGFGTADRAAKYAAKMDMPALGLTNHGNVCGVVDHFDACRRHGIKPVLGLEAYMVAAHPAKGRCRYHLTLLVQSASGYRNLMELVELSNAEGAFYRSPTVTLDQLAAHSEGIICLSGCGASAVAAAVRKHGHRGAINMLAKLHEAFGDRLYAELQSHGYPGQGELNMHVRDAAEAVGLKTCVTHDAHFVEREDFATYERLMELHRGEGAMKGRDGYWMVTSKEAMETWTLDEADFCRAMAGTHEVVSRVDFDIDSVRPSLPRVPHAMKWLRDAVFDWKSRTENKSGEYADRIDREMDIVAHQGFESYFCIVAEIVQWAKSQGIVVGFGRGSVGGSLLAYALGITRLDPIRWNVPFERFLRMDKKALPDIDLDFEHTHKDRVVEHAVKKYNARPIAAFGFYRHRNLTNDLIKAYGEHYRKTLNPLEEGGDIDHLIGLAMKHRRHGDLRVLDAYRRAINQIRYVGSHPGGVVMVGDDEHWMMPLMYSHGDYKCSFDLYAVERLGAMKLDILGLETASLMSRLERVTGDAGWVSFDDKRVFDALASQEVGEGVFQLEERGARGVVEHIEPVDIEELAVCISLNRPAPLSLGLVDKYAKRKGQSRRGVFADTRGVPVYQDQVWKLCQSVGMPNAESDKVMKLLKGDHPEWRKPVGDLFASLAVSNRGWPEARAREIFDSVTQYGFNKAHAIAYALTAYVTAWYAYHHPVEFFHSHLTLSGRSNKRYRYERAADRCGIIILGPHVNGSANYAIESIAGKPAIRRGLMQVKDVGPAAVEKIVQGQPYSGPTDFEERSGVNVRVECALDDAGATTWDEDEQAEKAASYIRWVRSSWR